MGVCFNKQQKQTSADQTEPQPQQPTIKRRQNVRLSVMPRHHHEQTNQQEKVSNKNISKPSQAPDQHGVMEISQRVFIHGVMGTRRQRSYQDKAVNSTTQSITLQQLSSIGIGVSCKKGLKPGSPNQDDFCLIIDPNFRLFCVFDGHGLFGHQISNYVKLTLPDLVIKSPHFISNPKQALFQAFKETNEELISYCRTVNFNCEDSGTTATVGLLQGNKLFVAHVGDSRGVLGSKKGTKNSSFRITTDHKPELPNETARIKATGGQIRRLPDDIPYRIFLPHQEGPGLSISRAIGDRIAQTIGVSCEPEIAELEINEESEYLVMCSDGVWEFINDQEAVTQVTKIGNKCKLASEKLAYLAWNRWIQNEEDVVDDITAMVVYLPWQNMDK